MIRDHRNSLGRLGCIILTACLPFCVGCPAVCLSEAGFLCGSDTSFSGDYTQLVVSRNDAPELTLFAKLPTAPSNGKAVLVAHSSSEDTFESARIAALQWGSFLSQEGFTVLAHAYREADSAYGQFDVADTLDAISWLNGEGAEQLGLEQVYLLGTSRGGVIAYQVSYQCTPDELAGIIADRGVSNFLLFESEVDRFTAGAFGQTIQHAVQLTLDWIGVLPEQNPVPWMGLSAGFNIDRIHVPMLVVHGEADMLVPVDQAQDFQARVRDAGREELVQFYVVPGRGHLDLGFDPNYRQTVLDFLNANQPTRLQ